MMKSLLILLIFDMLTCGIIKAQEVEHNYLVGPGVTTCDSLKIDDLPVDSSINTIRSAKFRFNQEFKMTRRQGLQMGEFYSCDNKLGFLIIKYDNKYMLFKEIQKQVWNNFISSGDPEGFFLKSKDSWDRIK